VVDRIGRTQGARSVEQDCEAVGIFKPHPSVYQLAVDRLGVAAARVCFVSWNGWDVAGAAHFGFRAV